MCWVTQERSRLEVQRHLLFDVFFFWTIGSLSLMLSTSILLFEGVRTIQSGIILKHSGEKNQGHQINSLYCKTKGSAVSSGSLGYTQGHDNFSLTNRLQTSLPSSNTHLDSPESGQVN